MTMTFIFVSLEFEMSVYILGNIRLFWGDVVMNSIKGMYIDIPSISDDYC